MKIIISKIDKIVYSNISLNENNFTSRSLISFSFLFCTSNTLPVNSFKNFFLFIL